MTYFGFLIQFVGIPIIIFSVLNWIDAKRKVSLPQTLQTWNIRNVIFAHIIVALIYTTPWDNYLVATKVWWYNPELVTGLVIGWVPIEEYTFFIVQTLMTGLILTWLMRRLPVSSLTASYTGKKIRHWSTIIVSIIWAISVITLIFSLLHPLSSWKHGTYLSLELSWALLPIILQLIIGADILWKHRRAVITTITATWIYLSVGDFFAIQSGTWTINPEQSLPFLIFGVLPIEEAIFFLLTNVLVVFGITLVMDKESINRVPAFVQKWLPLQHYQPALETTE